MASNRQWDNLLVLIGIYIAVKAVSSYFEKVTTPTGEDTAKQQIKPFAIATTKQELLQLANNFAHYALLGYFSANYWMIIILWAILSDLWDFYQGGFNLKDLVQKGFVQAWSAKFVGLIAGIVLNYYLPMKVSLWSIIKKVVE